MAETRKQNATLKCTPPLNEPDVISMLSCHYMIRMPRDFWDQKCKIVILFSDTTIAL